MHHEISLRTNVKFDEKGAENHGINFHNLDIGFIKNLEIFKRQRNLKNYNKCGLQGSNPGPHYSMP